MYTRMLPASELDSGFEVHYEGIVVLTYIMKVAFCQRHNVESLVVRQK